MTEQKPREFWVKASTMDLLGSASTWEGRRLNPRPIAFKVFAEKPEEDSVKFVEYSAYEKLQRHLITYSKFVSRMAELGQALPPNAVSMNIQKALRELEEV